MKIDNIKEVVRGLDITFYNAELTGATGKKGWVVPAIVSEVSGDDIKVCCTGIHDDGNDYGKEYSIKLEDICEYSDKDQEKLLAAIEADVNAAKKEALKKYRRNYSSEEGRLRKPASRYIRRGDGLMVRFKEYGTEFECAVEKDGIHDGKISVRIMTESDYTGKRCEISVDDITGVAGVIDCWTKELEDLDYVEEKGRMLFMPDGRIVNAVLRGYGITFNTQDGEIHGVIEKDYIHDGCISVIAISRNYGRRYEAGTNDVTGILIPEEGTKRTKQYNKALERAQGAA